MLVEALDQTAIAQSTFPATEPVPDGSRSRSSRPRMKAAVLHGGWRPKLDAVRMVAVVVTVEDLFPFRIPPEKSVRRGGY